ncbi:hypothetical protein [Lysinibacillus sphaericus]|nr:hypothetical protein [Lysinibacillus sp. SDF0037]
MKQEENEQYLEKLRRYEQARKDLFEAFVKTFKIDKLVNWLSEKLEH